MGLFPLTPLDLFYTQRINTYLKIDLAIRSCDSKRFDGTRLTKEIPHNRQLWDTW